VKAAPRPSVWARRNMAEDQGNTNESDSESIAADSAPSSLTWSSRGHPGWHEDAENSAANPAAIFVPVLKARKQAIATLRSEMKRLILKELPQTEREVGACAGHVLSLYAQTLFDAAADQKLRSLGSGDSEGTYSLWLRKKCLPAVLEDVYSTIDGQFLMSVYRIAIAIPELQSITDATRGALFRILTWYFFGSPPMSDLKHNLSLDLEDRSLYWESRPELDDRTESLAPVAEPAEARESSVSFKISTSRPTTHGAVASWGELRDEFLRYAGLYPNLSGEWFSRASEWRIWDRSSRGREAKGSELFCALANIAGSKLSDPDLTKATAPWQVWLERLGQEDRFREDGSRHWITQEESNEIKRTGKNLFAIRKDNRYTTGDEHTGGGTTDFIQDVSIPRVFEASASLCDLLRLRELLPMAPESARSTKAQDTRSAVPEAADPPTRTSVSANPEDPVSENPFPVDHPDHQVWRTATREAEIKLLRLEQDMLTAVPQTANQYESWYSKKVFGKFQIWAERGLSVLRTDEEARAYDRWLKTFLESWMKTAENWNEKELRSPSFLPELRLHLLKASTYWSANALDSVSKDQTSEDADAPVAQPRPSPNGLSDRDCKVHAMIGEKNFRAMTNAELTKG
jgi:hypothetical protein